MREILFRAWSEKRQCYELDVSIVNGCPVRYGYMWFNKENDVLESQPEQFTGEYDSTEWEELSQEEKYTFLKQHPEEEWYGRKIFEGDILKCVALSNDHHQKGAIVISPVEVWEGNACLSITHTPIYPFCIDHTLTIIGNIHDNPELVGEEAE